MPTYILFAGYLYTRLDFKYGVARTFKGVPLDSKSGKVASVNDGGTTTAAWNSSQSMKSVG
jgi:hypothetical protein